MPLNGVIMWSPVVAPSEHSPNKTCGKLPQKGRDALERYPRLACARRCLGEGWGKPVGFFIVRLFLFWTYKIPSQAWHLLLSFSVPVYYLSIGQSLYNTRSWISKSQRIDFHSLSTCIHGQLFPPSNYSSILPTNKYEYIPVIHLLFHDILFTLLARSFHSCLSVCLSVNEIKVSLQSRPCSTPPACWSWLTFCSSSLLLLHYSISPCTFPIFLSSLLILFIITLETSTPI